MLVEDELPLLQLLEKYLERLGYDVEAHARSSEALGRFEAEPSRYDLVIADLGMPEMPGDTLLIRMFQVKPDLLALICSGSEYFIATLPSGLREHAAFLQKPFVPKMLAEAIQRLLNDRRNIPADKP
jgi:DNA-binding NtrC family response regulator